MLKFVSLPSMRILWGRFEVTRGQARTFRAVYVYSSRSTGDGRFGTSGAPRCDMPDYAEKTAENAYFCMFLANHTTRIM